jgi:hypothetical protein
MTAPLPTDLARLVERTWRDGIIEEFDRSVSYFWRIHAAIRGDLLRSCRSGLFWETPDPHGLIDTDRDDDDEFGTANEVQFQSYQVFFLSPGGAEFVGAEETDGYAESEDPEEESGEATYGGERTSGYAVGISLLAPVAVISWSSMASFDDGSFENADVSPPGQGEPESVSKPALRKLEQLRDGIAKVLQKHKIRLLDEAELGTPAGLRACDEVFVNDPVRVFDAFFFRGV